MTDHQKLQAVLSSRNKPDEAIGCPAMAAQPEPMRHIVEFCTSHDSEMGTCTSADCRVTRITKNHDITSRRGFRYARAAIRLTLLTLLWVSLPCTGGSNWQAVNLTKGPATVEKVLEPRADFDKAWDNTEQLMGSSHTRGGG